MKYACLRCGIDFKQKCHLENHLNRKNTCEPILEPMGMEEVKKYYGFDHKSKTEPKLNQTEPKLNPNEPKMNPFEPKMNPKKSLSKSEIEPKMNPFEPKKKSTEPKLNPFAHTNQKVSDNTVKYICEFCNKSYSTNSHMRRHQKTCNKNVSSAMEIEILKENQKKMEREYNKLQQTVENLKICSNGNISNNNSHNTTNNITNKTKNEINNNDNSTNINVTINNYGNENRDYITKQYLINLLKAPFQAIPRLIEYTHFNKDHPENQNIKLPNKKQPYVKVLKDDKWVYADRKSTILDLIDEKHSQLNEEVLKKHVEEHFSEHLQDRFERFNERYLNDEKDFTSQVYKETELIMINNNIQ